MLEDDNHLPFEETSVGRSYEEGRHAEMRAGFVGAMVRMTRVAVDPTAPLHDEFLPHVEYNLQEEGTWGLFWQTARDLVLSGASDEEATLALLEFGEENGEALSQENDEKMARYIQENPEESEEVAYRVVQARLREESKPQIKKN